MLFAAASALLLGGCDLLFQIDKLKQQPDGGLDEPAPHDGRALADASPDVTPDAIAKNCVVDDFATLDTSWRTFANPPTSTVGVDGGLSITLNQAARDHGGVDGTTRDYTGTSIEVDVLSVPDPQSETYMDWASGDDWYSIAVDHGLLSYGYSVNGSDHTNEIPYEATKHRGFKMAHDRAANVIRMSVRNTLGEWTVLGTVPVAIPMTSLNVELAAGSYTSSESSGVARFDNFVTCN